MRKQERARVRVSLASRLLLVRCLVLHETHEMERQRNEHPTRMERVSLLTCSWSVLYSQRYKTCQQLAAYTLSENYVLPCSQSDTKTQHNAMQSTVSYCELGFRIQEMC